VQLSSVESGGRRATAFRSLATKFFIFTATLVFWVVATLLAYNLRQDNFDVTKGLLVFVVVLLVAGASSRFTIRLLIRPLRLLQEGIISVRNGRLEPVEVSKTSDEIEYLGESFNSMIQALKESREQVRQHQALLEQRIQRRTEEVEIPLGQTETNSETKSDSLADLSHKLAYPDERSHRSD
jgi:methyl-accepting chemotaxis protein